LARASVRRGHAAIASGIAVGYADASSVQGRETTVQFLESSIQAEEAAIQSPFPAVTVFLSAFGSERLVHFIRISILHSRPSSGYGDKKGHVLILSRFPSEKTRPEFSQDFP
jgi:hypothetical protein